MKSNYLFAVALIWWFPFSELSAQSFSSPVQYLQEINAEYHLITKDTWDYTKTAAHSRNAKKVENRRKELMITTLNAKRKIAKLPPYEGNTALRDSIASCLHLSYLILKEDYAKIVDLEAIAEQSYDQMEAYMLAIQESNKKRDKAYKMVDLEMEKFADEFNINFSEGNKSRLSQKLEKAGEVYDYYNPIYLIFFKSFKQETYLIEALNNNDMAAFEQNRNALLQYTEEGLSQLRKVSAYNADLSLKRACQSILLFYQNEALEKAPYYSDFNLKKDNMLKLQKAMESKPKSTISQDEADTYNKSIKEYNDTLKEFNKVNNEVNKLREKHFSAWKTTSRNFLDKHVP